MKNDFLIIELRKTEEDESEIPEGVLVKHQHRFQIIK